MAGDRFDALCRRRADRGAGNGGHIVEFGEPGVGDQGTGKARFERFGVQLQKLLLASDFEADFLELTRKPGAHIRVKGDEKLIALYFGTAKHRRDRGMGTLGDHFALAHIQIRGHQDDLLVIHNFG